MIRQANSSSSSTPVLIREATEQDLPAIRNIYNYFVTRSTATFALEDESVDERLAWFVSHSQNGLPVLIAELDGSTVGWASLSYYHQRCAYRQSVEPSLYIHHEFAARGIGKVLTLSLIHIFAVCDATRKHQVRCSRLNCGLSCSLSNILC